jgi:hypothetical protein
VTRWLGRYLAANAFALAWTLFAVTRPWVGTAFEDDQRELLQRTLPLALVAAAAVTAFVATLLPDAGRDGFLRRHFAMYAVVPVLLFLLSRGGGVTTQHLGAVYLLAILAWTAHAIEGLWHSVANLPDRRAALALAAVLIVPFLAQLPYHNSVIPTASDEPHYLVIVQSLIHDRDLDLTNQYETESYREFYPDRLPDIHAIQVGPWQYPIRDLGLPFIAALPFAVAGRAGVVALMCIVGAVLAAQLYLACRDLRIGHRPALFGTALASLVHPAFTYTTQIYPELLAALVFVTAARLVRAGRAATPLALAGAAALAGLLPWLSTRAALIALGLGIAVAYFALRPLPPVATSQRLVRLVAAAAPFVVPVMALAIVNGLMFGRFMLGAGYYLVSDQQPILTFAPHIGALGLMFDRTFGLIPRAPVFLVCALGALVLWGRGPFIYIASLAFWWADGGPPSRYLVAGFPLLAVLLAACLERLDSARVSAWRAVAAGLAAFSLFIAYVYAVLPQIAYDIAIDIRLSERDGQLFEFVGRLVRPSPADAFPSVVRGSPLDLAFGAAWLAVLVVFLLMARGAGGRAPLRREGT